MSQEDHLLVISPTSNKLQVTHWAYSRSLASSASPTPFLMCRSKEKKKLTFHHGRHSPQVRHQRQGFDRKLPLVLSVQDPSLYSGILELSLLLTQVREKVEKRRHVKCYGWAHSTFHRRNCSCRRERVWVSYASTAKLLDSLGLLFSSHPVIWSLTCCPGIGCWKNEGMTLKSVRAKWVKVVKRYTLPAVR